MVNDKIKDLIASMREDRGQSSEPHVPGKDRERKRYHKGDSHYGSFLMKYNDLEKHIDTFGTRDLVYYFREIAEGAGQKYVIANAQKDMAIMKRLKESYSVREICAMIEFMYFSEQDYIEKERMSINILGSSWINTIYADMKLWVDDRYVPASAKKAVKKHEWSKSGGADNDTKIGVKL